MPNVPTRIMLFLCSYLPLSLIFFLLFLDNSVPLASLSLLAGISGLIWTLLYLKEANKLVPSREEVAEVSKRDSEVVGYIAGYLVPFVTIPFESLAQALALGVFVLVICFIYVNSNMIYLNPTLGLLGYRLYEVTLEGGGTHFLVTRSRVVRSQVLYVVKNGENILLEKRSGSRNLSTQPRAGV
jgi:hypothetical protein